MVGRWNNRYLLGVLASGAVIVGALTYDPLSVQLRTRRDRQEARHTMDAVRWALEAKDFQRCRALLRSCYAHVSESGDSQLKAEWAEANYQLARGCFEAGLLVDALKDLFLIKGPIRDWRDRETERQAAVLLDLVNQALRRKEVEYLAEMNTFVGKGSIDSVEVSVGEEASLAGHRVTRDRIGMTSDDLVISSIELTVHLSNKSQEHVIRARITGTLNLFFDQSSREQELMELALGRSLVNRQPERAFAKSPGARTMKVDETVRKDVPPGESATHSFRVGVVPPLVLSEFSFNALRENCFWLRRRTGFNTDLVVTEVVVARLDKTKAQRFRELAHRYRDLGPNLPEDLAAAALIADRLISQ